MTECHDDSVSRRRRLDQIEDIDDWLDAVGDELAREFPDLIDEPPSHTGNPFGEQGANERGATVRELRIPTMPITSSDKPITDSGASRSPWRSEVHSGAGGSGFGVEV